MKILENHIKAISESCKSHHVRDLYAFGSVLTKKFSEKSDIDLLVDFEFMELSLYADNYFNFKDSLQQILNHNIDLLEIKAIKNPIFKEHILSQRLKIYGS